MTHDNAPALPPSLADFERIAEAAFAALPQAFRAQCGNLLIRVADFADDATLDEMEIDDPFELTGLYDLVAISGSLILGLAVSHGRLSVDDAWAASRVDADWQEEQWGVDDEAARTAAFKREEFGAAARLIDLARSE